MDCRVPKAVIRNICLLLLLIFSSSTVAFRTHEIDYQIDPAAVYTYCLPRHEVVSLPSKLRRKLLKYPSYDQRRLSLLQVDLAVSTTAVTSIPDELVNYKCNLEELMINNTCEFLPAYLDLLFGPHLVQVCPPAEDQDYSQTTPVVVSGRLGIMGQCICYNHVWLSVEGLYDPRVGSMHLTGCRIFNALNNASLEQGQDCMIEVQVQYPPINMRWLFNQKLQITISSQRDKQDSMYFRRIVILTPPITYRWQSSQKQFIRTYETCLRIILLIMAFLCVTYQFTHMNSTQGEASSSYISLVMLGIQLSSYFYPFITCSDITFPSADGSDSHDRTSFIQIMYHLVIYEISGIFRLVWARRAKPNSPSDIKVLIITLSIHVLGLSIFLNRAPLSLAKLFVPFEHIKAYWGLVLDLFLLPQIIANRLWRIRSKPLQKIYYIGFSMARAFPHLYNYFRDPAYVTTAKEDDGSAVNRFSDIAIAITVMLLAFVVYIQQRCCIDDSPTEPASQTEIMEQQEDS
ncbi:hypothetical protein QQ045_012995 [Rhodiola kirilowii]